MLSIFSQALQQLFIDHLWNKVLFGIHQQFICVESCSLQFVNVNVPGKASVIMPLFGDIKICCSHSEAVFSGLHSQLHL